MSGVHPSAAARQPARREPPRSPLPRPRGSRSRAAARALAITGAENPTAPSQVHYRWCAQSAVSPFPRSERPAANGFIKAPNSRVDQL